MEGHIDSTEHLVQKRNSTERKVLINRKAISRLMQTSPKMRDVLRERYKARMKENRGQLIQHLRNLGTKAEIERVIHRTFQEEMLGFSMCPNIPMDDYIEESLRTLKEMETESLTAEEEWVMKEYDSLFDNNDLYDSIFEASFNEVICPICQKDKMSSSNGYISCHSCGAAVPAKVSLEAFNQKIGTCIDEHDELCSQKPMFSLIPGDDICLCMMCPQCNFLSVVI